MGKLTTLIIILATTLTVLNLLGVIQGSTMGSLFTLITNPEQFFTSSFFTQNWSAVATLAGSAVAGAVAIGLLVTGKGDMAIKAPIAAILLPIGHDIIALYSTLVTYGSVSKWLGLIFISPLAVIFILAVIDWWGGSGG